MDVIVSLGSHHNPDRGYCERNPGVFVQSGGVVAGTYRNSLCRQSWLLNWHQPFVRGAWGSLGLQGGVVTGYGRIPLAAAVRADIGPLVLLIVPPLPPRTGPTDFVVAAAVKFSF